MSISASGSGSGSGQLYRQQLVQQNTKTLTEVPKISPKTNPYFQSP